MCGKEGQKGEEEEEKTIHQYSAQSIPCHTTWTAAIARPVGEEHLFLWWLTEACSDAGSALNLHHRDTESPLTQCILGTAFLSVGQYPNVHLKGLGPANQSERTSDGRQTNWV